MKTYTVLWFDQRDGFGILTDAAGNELYTHSSVVDHAQWMFNGVKVRGSAPYKLGDCMCVKNVRVDLDSAYKHQDRVVDKLQAYDQDQLREGAVAEALATLELLKDEINACQHDDRENGHCIDCGHVKHGE